MPELELTVILYTIVNFVIVVVLLRLLLFKPVLKIIDKRKAAIRGEMEAADEKVAKANAMFQEAEVDLQQKREDAARLIDEARRSAEARKDALMHETRDRAQALMARVENEIRLERRHNLKKQQGAIVDLSVQLASHLIGDTIDADSHRVLIDDFLDQLEEPK